MFRAQRQLDDEDLDSGDDEGRRDRLEDEDESQRHEEEQQLSVMEAAFDRHGIPEPSDKEVCVNGIACLHTLIGP